MFECECGHMQDEHADSGFFRECLIEGCDCSDYEERPEEDD